MPSVDFTLPHWMYAAGLVLFPLLAMYLARRGQTEKAKYGAPLGYLILVTGGMIGLHRFYLKSLLGLVFIPIFLVVLIANAQERDARSAYSDAQNMVRVAERTLEREIPRVATAEAEIDKLRLAVDEKEEGSFAKKSAERQVARAEAAIANGHEKIDEARVDIDTFSPTADIAAQSRTFWGTTAKYAFYLILLFMGIDAILMPRLVARAQRLADSETELVHEIDAETAARAAKFDPEARKADKEYVENWVDKFTLLSGEFVSYWAVIAVLVYYYEVIVRYVFNSPTSWAHESMYLMFGMQYLIAGSYAMLTESHVRVDIFYAPLSKPRKAWVDLLTSIFFFIFAGTLLVTSYIFAMDSIAVATGNSVVSDWARGDLPFFEMLGQLFMTDWTDPNIRLGEISFNEWEVPLWPMKWMMVVGAVLLILQGTSKVSKDIRTIARGI